jgi:hypothetical protein
MNDSVRFVGASVALGLLTFVAGAGVASGQSGPKPTAVPSTWVQYVADLRPNLEQGQWGLTIDSKFWDKYDGMAIQWAGTLKECRKDEKAGVVCDVTMPAQPVKVKTNSGVVSITLDQVGVIVEKSEAEKWQALKVGAPVRFSAKAGATVGVLLSKDPAEKPRVGIPLTEGRVLVSK